MLTAVAVELRLQSIERRREALGEYEPETLSAMVRLANAYRHHKTHQEEWELRLLILEGYRQELGENDPNTLSVMAGLLEPLALRSTQGKVEEKLEESVAVNVLKRRSRILGSCHPDTMMIKAYLVMYYLKRSMFRSAWKILDQSYPEQIGSTDELINSSLKEAESYS